jgi:beta-mannosidase
VYVLNTDIDIFRQGSINHLPPDQSKPWVVNASIDYLGDLPDGSSMTFQITDPQNRNATLASGDLQNITTSGNSITGVVLIGADTPKLWWPNGLGEQNLYYLSVNVVDSRQKSLATVTKRTCPGYRSWCQLAF